MDIDKFIKLAEDNQGFFGDDDYGRVSNSPGLYQVDMSINGNRNISHDVAVAVSIALGGNGDAEEDDGVWMIDLPRPRSGKVTIPDGRVVRISTPMP